MKDATERWVDFSVLVAISNGLANDRKDPLVLIPILRDKAEK